MEAKENIHYVDNEQFSQAVVEYVTNLNYARENNIEPYPKVTDYIAMCFLKIAEGLSHKANFIRYTYREEMVMDAVENCLKAIDNYDLSVATRTGKPNAFAYFTQISWYAFLRRIMKEKKQQDIKIKFVAESGFEEFINQEFDDEGSQQMMQSFVDSLKERIDHVKEKDRAVKDYAKQERKSKKTASVDSDLEEFM